MKKRWTIHLARTFPHDSLHGRRGWDTNHPEVRPRLIAAAGALAVEMGYISENDMYLPGQIALDPERVTNVVETLNEVLESFGRKPARTVEELDEIQITREQMRLKSLDALSMLQMQKLDRFER